jgi:leader peptidase (prepilin peptidase)/N-methyltransferase
VELVTGILFAALYLRFGLSWTLLEFLVFGWGLVVVSVIDLDHRLLPDVFTLPGMGLGLVGAWLNPERHFVDAILGAAFGFGFLWAVSYVYLALRKEEGMGGGDIKLLGWIGALLGWKAVVFTILTSSIIGSIVGLSLAAVRRTGLKTAIPFGPFLALAAFIYVFAGHQITQSYISFFLPVLD